MDEDKNDDRRDPVQTPEHIEPGPSRPRAPYTPGPVISEPDKVFKIVVPEAPDKLLDQI